MRRSRRTEPCCSRPADGDALMAQPDRSDLDPITVEIVRHKLDGIANEMQSTLLRSSFSPIVKEGLDASASLFTPDGTTLAQSCSIPIHLATLIPAVAAVLETYPVATMRDGDAFILNDPYAGGTHLPDIAVIMPVCHRGRVIALSAAMTHHQDVGGMTRRLGADQRHRDLSGRAAHPAAQTARCRRAERHAAGAAAPQCPHPGYGDRRSERADRRLHGRRPPHLGTRRALWRQSARDDRRRAAAALGTDDAAGIARDPGGDLSLRRFSRQ